MEKLLTPDQVAELLAISRKTVYRIIKAGKLEAIKVNSILRIPEENLKLYIEKNKKVNIRTQKKLSESELSLEGIVTDGSPIPEESIDKVTAEWERG